MPLIPISLALRPYVSLWRVDEAEDELLSLLPSSLASFYKEENERLFRSDTRRIERLAARVLLHQRLGMTVRVAYFSSGKPYLQDESRFKPHKNYFDSPNSRPVLQTDNRSVSFSHSGKYVAMAVCPEGEVCIYVERRAARVWRVLSRFVGPDERVSCSQLTKEEQTLYYTIAWSAKESIYKAANRESLSLLDIYLSPFIPQTEGEFFAKIAGSDIHWRLQYQVFTDCVLTYCRRA